MAKTEFVRIELTPTAKAKADGLADERGMTQFALLSRLVGWFAVQDAALQAVVLGHFAPEITPDVANLLMKGSSR